MQPLELAKAHNRMQRITGEASRYDFGRVQTSPIGAFRQSGRDAGLAGGPGASVSVSSLLVFTNHRATTPAEPARVVASAPGGRPREAAAPISWLLGRHCGSQGWRQCAAEGSCPAGRDGEVQVPEFVHTLLASRIRTRSISPLTRPAGPSRGAVACAHVLRSRLGFADVGPIP
jgi:hypothetical protein